MAFFPKISVIFTLIMILLDFKLQLPFLEEGLAIFQSQQWEKLKGTFKMAVLFSEHLFLHFDFHCASPFDAETF